MGLFKSYQTNKDLEKSGVVFTPDSTTAITIARAGGSNVQFSKMLDFKAKPYRRQIESGTLDPQLDRRMMAEIYAETIVRNWETLVEVDGKPQLVQGIEAMPDAPEGTYTHTPDKNGLVPFNAKNVVSTFLLLPDLFIDVQREAQSIANFRQEERKADEGN